MTNREIKFRAWNKEKKEMVTNFFVCGKAVVFYDKLYHIGEYGYNLKSYYDNVWEKQFVIMQYTGLKDKNGKEVYEGDILQDDEGDIAEVRWSDQKAAFVADLIGEKGKVYDEFSLEDFGGIIIGNIYENSELLPQPNQRT